MDLQQPVRGPSSRSNWSPTCSGEWSPRRSPLGRGEGCLRESPRPDVERTQALVAALLWPSKRASMEPFVVGYLRCSPGCRDPELGWAAGDQSGGEGDLGQVFWGLQSTPSGAGPDAPTRATAARAPRPHRAPRAPPPDNTSPTRSATTALRRSPGWDVTRRPKLDEAQPDQTPPRAPPAAAFVADPQQRSVDPKAHELDELDHGGSRPRWPQSEGAQKNGRIAASERECSRAWAVEPARSSAAATVQR